MASRTSSTNDLFLSVVDLYSLLSFLFIGFTFMAREGAQESVLSLPVVDRVGAQIDHDVPVVEWSVPPSGITGLRHEADSTCEIRVARLGGWAKTTGKTFAIACLPAAFGGRGAETLGASELRKLAGTVGGSTAVACDAARGAVGLNDCARLQWTLSALGFSPVAQIRTTESK